MTTATVDRIVYESDGVAEDGRPPVLMIHGLGGSSNTWAAVMPAFDRHRTLRIDLPGSGRSDRVEGALSIERFAQAVMRVAADAGARSAHLVAHSMGCIVAFRLAVHEPAFVRSLALFGPLLAPPDAARDGIRARARRARADGTAGMQAIADGLLETAVSTQTRQRRRSAYAFVRESLMRQSPDGYARTCEALAAAEAVDPARIHCPTLLVTGDEDMVAPAQAVRRIGERINDARTEVLPGCGHWEPIEKPDECTTLLREFLAHRR